MPVAAFSECGPGAKGKLPLHWFSVPSRPIFAFAGVWRPMGDDLPAFAFLTSAPNALVEPIHPKAMEVIFHDENIERRLTADYA